MPEGDTIFRAARRLQQALAGKTVTHFETALAQLARIDRDEPLAGRSVASVSSLGKHLLIEFSGDLILRTHMRMNGSWHLYRPGERWRLPRADMRVVVSTAEFVAVGFNIPVAEFHTTESLARQKDIRAIGPDLLGQELDPSAALERLRSRPSLSIAEALLNQRLVAGIGNVFKSEVLFSCGIDPFASVASLSDQSLLDLVRTGQKLMALNVRDSHSGGITTYIGFRRTTGRSDPAERLWVYGRRGKPCRKCGTAIGYRKQGLDARSTYWCPQCQKSVP